MTLALWGIALTIILASLYRLYIKFLPHRPLPTLLLVAIGLVILGRATSPLRPLGNAEAAALIGASWWPAY